MIQNLILSLPNILLLKNIFSEAQDYYSLFTSIDNPVYISIAITFFIIIFLYLTVKFIIGPLKRQHIKAENELKLQNIRLMALFADLDPDPLLRLDLSGNVLFINPAAKKCGFELFMGKKLDVILPHFNINVEEIINNSISHFFIETYNNKIYNIQVNGIKNLEIAQLYFHDITELTLNQRALEVSEKELKEFSKNLQMRIEEERQRISTELHDDVGQNLLLLRLNLQRQFSEITGEANSKYYLECTDIIDHAVRDLKNISYSLKPMALKELGLVPALFSLVNKVSQECGIKGSFGSVKMENRFDQNLETAIYRIVQEALNNIIKYSKAKEFNIEVINNGKKIHIIISDDGIGFNKEAVKIKNGMGITNMKERTEAFGGTFRINSSAEEGTIIIADFPLEGN